MYRRFQNSPTYDGVLFDYEEYSLFGGLFEYPHILPIPSPTYFSSIFLGMEGDDYAGDATTTGVLPLDGSELTGMIEVSGDDDWFAFTVEAGDVINLTIDSTDESLRRHQLRIVTADGTELASVHPFVGFLTLELATLSAGTYYASVRAGFNSFGNSYPDTGGYRVTATTHTDEYTGDVNTLGFIETGGDAVSGRFDSQFDYDWLRFNASESEIIHFAMMGPNGSRTATFRIHDAQGTLVQWAGSGVSFMDQLFETAGTYFLSVFASGSGQNSDVYSITATERFDDFGNGILGATEIATNGMRVEGVVDYHSDEDWFVIHVEAGDTFQFEVDALDNELDGATLRLYAIDGITSLLTLRQAGGIPAAYHYEFSQAGDYYISVYSENSVGTGRYDVLAERVVDDFGDDISTEGELQLGGPIVQGEYETRDDEDWFRVDVEAGEIIAFSISGIFGGGIRLFDAHGTVLPYANGNAAITLFGSETDNVNLRYVFDYSGTIFVAVNPSYNIGTYQLSASRVVDDFLANSSTTGTAILGGTITGVLDFSGDEDWFAFSATSGQAIEVNSTSTIGHYVSVYDQNGVLLASVLDSFGQLRYEFLETSTYYLAVGTSYTSNGFEGYTYDLTFDSLTDDIAGSSATNETIILGGAAVQGVINYYGDRDWFAINVSDGQVVQFTYTDLNNAISNEAIQIVDAHGRPVEGLTPSLDIQTQLYQFDNGGTYYFSLSATSHTDGVYEINTSILSDDFGNGTETAGAVSINGASVSGDRDFVTDVDWFAVDVVAGQTIEFFLDSFGLLGGGTLTLYDVNLDIVASGINLNVAGEIVAQLEHSVLTTGQYFIAVDFNSSNLGNYTLSATNISTAPNSSHSIYGTNASDAIIGSSVMDIIHGLDGDDVISAFAGNDIVRAGSGHDTIAGGVGDDEIYGDSGDDIISGNAGNDRLIGGSGNNTLMGGMGNDRLYGGGNDHIYGGEGDDILEGHGGDDFLYGGAGNDVIIASSGAHHIYGGAGDDLIQLYAQHTNIIDGGDGIDTVQFTASRIFGGMIIHLDITTFQNTRSGDYVFIDVENIIGYNYDDIIGGNAENNRLEGMGGDDILYGREGDDALFGGFGDDTIFGGSGADYLDGGNGVNVLNGDAGDDVLRGGVGDDTLSGGTGSDILRGREGDNILSGGEGSDIFVIGVNAGNDQILDFENGVDRIVFSDGVFHFSQLKFIQDGADVLIYSVGGITRLVDTDISTIDATDFSFILYSDDEITSVQENALYGSNDSEGQYFALHTALETLQNINDEVSSTSDDTLDDFIISEDQYLALRAALEVIPNFDSYRYIHNEQGLLEFLTPDDATHWDGNWG